MSKPSFNFTLLDINYYNKEGLKKCVITCYCSYGFLVNMYTSCDNGKKLEQLANSPTFDINNFIEVGYERKTDKFRYFLNLNSK